MFNYQLHKADQIPVILTHQRKFSQKDYMNMFDECVEEYKSQGNTKFNILSVAKLMQEKFGFGCSGMALTISVTSSYPALFREEKDEPIIKDNVIVSEMNRQYWKKEENRSRRSL
ncbi:hypothetical protein PP175_26455 (plasmid) [Aneurinibacillus sp. Ricciae_BoGa-3]|uniref:hypothetical protein n=1 Tax=Aneurinibacillus sp. Ricciae_BoGa-3 TaxID=3022697 RepID=UPI00233FB9AB|nr:hypothetical protein [Aneurinibacillus sp. Ricciae_BoGa-3]WCK57607.1 hypothetical protein PP175_26455 [Aneurinibacillus sp. Ricciae_BoGa-3]